MAAEQNNDTRTNAQSARLESEHTHGPWKAEGDFDTVREDYREDRFVTTEDFDESAGSGSIIGVLRGHGPELRANARLIAAAPDMFAALKAWEFARREGGISHADFFESAWKKTAAAIAKAEGTARR